MRDNELSVACLVSTGNRQAQSGASLRYLLRIMHILSGQRRIGISDLALLARINHQRCVAQVEWLEQLRFVRVSTANKRKEVIVTETGADLFAKLNSLFTPFDALGERHLVPNIQDPISISRTQIDYRDLTYKM